jgi:diadenosine tetraphosphatase ApaH/serine/threonine PP2A family protein phosphatase
MIAIISDIHANREAFEAVIEEINILRPQKVICLGDVVGYGPDPAWCIDAVQKTCQVVIGGNHDFALIYGATQFSENAGASIRFHRQILMPRMEGSPEDERKAERWNFLKGLPHRHVEDGMLFVHGSPRNPVNEYLRDRDCLLKMNKKLTENFELVEWLCFIGHTHSPGVITGEFKFVRPEHYWRVEPGKKAIINVGSVGQPRDGDCRACFVTLDGPEVHFIRVEYDVEKTAQKIEASGGLKSDFADRLRKGL